MKVLIVCSGNSGNIAPFITEQAQALQKQKIETKFFLISGRGIPGYLKNYKPYLNSIKNFKPDIIHAHFGLSGLFANLQRKIPVVTTYHGCDINNPKNYYYSRLSAMLSKKNIFVSEKNVIKAKQKKKYALLPCGIDTELFQPVDMKLARSRLNLSMSEIIILFAGSFHRDVKNPKLAKKSAKQIKNATLIELKGYTRNEVSLLLNASNLLLMTSKSEGSPQVIKEAMACNCPIVSTDVGDVKWIFGHTKGCFVSSFDPVDVSEKIKSALDFSAKHQRTNGRQRVFELGLDSESVANKIKEYYQTILKQ